ncbi:DUF2163 domain-containing protein [Sinorhizobium meliloti]|nr:DUF2163 domain-containing protein [Sinorhizobium meliloti]MDW9847233.1 DUF2163 domain-containing protein [Sinorhizobium meliloti]MDX0147558.1 DUF2163 domain-containing protein [Sinorhizobium meliloti]MDX0150061.1 DUF2163 domain-containing protein [Sinorhizobium meliloti]MDX0169240.1 DUF2163 domain-containing protein [Sinorhizobium meliloti]
MSVLSPEVEDLIESGAFALIDLIRFDLPGKTVGYHRGGRKFTYNGLEYLPNRFLESGETVGSVGIAVPTRTIVFSNIPVTDPEDAMARSEEFNYQNSPVIITTLVGEPNTSNVVGVLVSTIYEIDQVRYNEGAISGSERTLTMMIDLQPPGRSSRGSTGVKRSSAEQKFDNDPADTGLEMVATNANIPEEWGQVSR